MFPRHAKEVALKSLSYFPKLKDRGREVRGRRGGETKRKRRGRKKRKRDP